MHTVTPIRPDIPQAGTGYRIHHARPHTTGIDFTEWCIEEQMATAVDTASDAPFAALIAFNPAMDLALVDAADRLYALQQEVGQAILVGDVRTQEVAAADYRDSLYALACTLRGSR